MVPPSLTDPFAPIRRQALLVILRVSVVGAVLTLLLSVLQRWGAGYVVALTLLLVELSALLAWLRRRPGAHHAVSAVYFTIAALSSVGHFAWSAVHQQDLTNITGSATWLPLLYLTAFLVLSPRRAARAVTLLYFTLLLVMTLFFAWPDVPTARKVSAVNACLQLALSHAVLIAMCLLWSRLLGGALREARSAYEDALTRLPNRRQLSAWLAQAAGTPAAVILFDLDHFKRVNDTHGHDVGDEVLRETGALLAGALPGDAQFGRWGGEEFLVIVTASAAQATAATLASRIAGHAYPGGLRLTASFGVALAHAAEDERTWVARADAALYDAKRAGRARVQVAP
ncbi:GGDEF domain-containing protein [Deinococcus maricopensis]|uniref:Diguanylate cyclase n=1 Tax=Deinococcus maricopensis (strain DSM 21211 / LMG 22137 / NRRL B-23946 / LB-34) TaxID=709986 RepID=E8U8J3_DEIML|nr:GGDEF domain-containing protein [Deinococcus maricopensis]ADV67382.1 diguanylate cyclase [Deinococcus maricopensis DSM 21211]